MRSEKREMSKGIAATGMGRVGVREETFSINDSYQRKGRVLEGKGRGENYLSGK